MATDVSVARTFLADFAKDRRKYDEGAQLLVATVRRLLSSANVFAHSIEARVKDVDSVRDKLLRKQYKDPARALTDLIGLRVITYYAAEVDGVADKIQSEFRIHKRHSTDKRTALNLREFGYRSYHLIAQIKANHLSDARFASIKSVWFEIQVRSLLEHCWAAMEHEVVYKSGADLPDECRRRFAALAGTLELLDREFSALRAEQAILINTKKSELEAGNALDESLDAVRLLAGLEVWRPNGLSFRDAELAGKPFPPKIASRFVLALRELGIANVEDLRERLADADFLRATSRYATAEGIIPDNLSHLAVLNLIVGLINSSFLDVFFPELAIDPSVVAAI